MGGRGLDGVADAAHALGHGRHGIGALPGLARVGGDAGHGDLEPGATLVGHLDLPVGGLGVQHPLVGAHPTGPDGRLHAAHEVLLVHRADEAEPAPGKALLPGNATKQREERGEGAGQAALHVAGAAAVEVVADDLGAEGADALAPALAQGDGVHVADVDQARLVGGAGNGDHEVASVGQRLELLHANGRGQLRRHLDDTCLHQRLYVLLDPPLVRAGVRAVNAHQVCGQVPGCVHASHLTTSLDTRHIVGPNCPADDLLAARCAKD